jgi:chaperonin GroES
MEQAMSDTISVKKITPLAGYVLIEPVEAISKTKSGIYLPGDEGEKPQYGKIIACGDAIYQDGREISCPVKKGTQVIYKKWGGNEFKVGEKEYMFIKFEDLLAVIK